VNRGCQAPKIRINKKSTQNYQISIQTASTLYSSSVWSNLNHYLLNLTSQFDFCILKHATKENTVWKRCSWLPEWSELRKIISSNYPIFFSFLFIIISMSVFFSVVFSPCLVFSFLLFSFSLWNCDYFKFPVHPGGSIAWGVSLCMCAHVWFLVVTVVLLLQADRQKLAKLKNRPSRQTEGQ